MEQAVTLHSSVYLSCIWLGFSAFIAKVYKDGFRSIQIATYCSSIADCALVEFRNMLLKPRILGLFGADFIAMYCDIWCEDYAKVYTKT